MPKKFVCSFVSAPLLTNISTHFCNNWTNNYEWRSMSTHNKFFQEWNRKMSTYLLPNSEQNTSLLIYACANLTHCYQPTKATWDLLPVNTALVYYNELIIQNFSFTHFMKCSEFHLYSWIIEWNIILKYL